MNPNEEYRRLLEDRDALEIDRDLYDDELREMALADCMEGDEHSLYLEKVVHELDNEIAYLNSVLKDYTHV